NWMAERGARHLVLLGRSEPAANARAQIKQLEESGVHIEVVIADITDEAAIEEEMFQKGDSSRPLLRGIIHAAGTLSDVLIQQMSSEQLDKVLAPKVTGAWNLHKLTQHYEQKLDFFILFSSAAGLLGSPGQVNHAMANAFLDGLARYRQQLNLPALSINWGAWSTVGSALKYQEEETLKRLSGVGLIDPSQGLAQLDNVWTMTEAQVGIVPIHWPSFLSQPAIKDQSLFSAVKTQRQELHGSKAEQRHNINFIQTLKRIPAAQQRTALEAHVCQQICQTLGFNDSELDRQAGFFDLGMDSLTALELKNSLQTDLEISLPSTLVFDYPTVEALLGYLSSQLISNEPSPLSDVLEKRPLTSELSADDLTQRMDQKLAELDSILGNESVGGEVG
ncbi:MAG: beta-ketoacyl reductase, partial [Cyanobacteria bacterium J06623_4]